MNAVPFYKIAKQSAAVLALLGSSEPRIYGFGQNDDEESIYPYVTFQVIPGGNPFNTLACRPDADRVPVQVDVWAKTAASARQVAQAIRDAIELSCYITSWRGESRDSETKSFRISFDCDWIVKRNP